MSVSGERGRTHDMPSNMMREKSPPGLQHSAHELRREEACKGCWMLTQRKALLTRQQATWGAQLEVTHDRRCQKKGHVCVSWTSLARSPITPTLQNA